MKTSGLMFTENADGSVRAEVVDYGVEEFGGHDWESWYDLDSVNAKKLFDELKKEHSGTFKQMMVAEFGEVFEAFRFERFCREKGIKFERGSWY
jgi:hypothetical protein